MRKAWWCVVLSFFSLWGVGWYLFGFDFCCSVLTEEHHSHLLSTILQNLLFMPADCRHFLWWGHELCVICLSTLSSFNRKERQAQWGALGASINLISSAHCSHEWQLTLETREHFLPQVNMDPPPKKKPTEMQLFPEAPLGLLPFSGPVQRPQVWIMIGVGVLKTGGKLPLHRWPWRGLGKGVPCRQLQAPSLRVRKAHDGIGVGMEDIQREGYRKLRSNQRGGRERDTYTQKSN